MEKGRLTWQQALEQGRSFSVICTQSSPGAEGFILARELDELLASVIQGDGTAELKAALNDISSKWQFIRGSYINYNENNVGFVIDRYSKGILKGLATTIELLLGNA